LHIDSKTHRDKIAERFREDFAASSFDSYVDSAEVTKLRERLFSATDLPFNDVFSIADIEHALQCLKSGKSSGIDGITKEHLTYSHPAVVIHLQFLFNCILMHGCVPDQFGVGVVVPLIKDSLGDVNSSANYRGITLSVICQRCLSIA